MKTFILYKFFMQSFSVDVLQRESNQPNKWSLIKKSKVVYRDYKSSFRDLLQMDNSVTFHERNIKTLAREIFKVSKGLSTFLREEIFQKEVPISA